MNTINGQVNPVNDNSAHAEPAVKVSDKKISAETVNITKIENEKRRAESQKAATEPIDPQKIADSVEKANKLVLIFDKSTRFVYNQKLGVNFIDIVDNNTNEVIKKIPTEEMRRFLEAVEGAVGMIVDEKA
jgi:flagellar protein FlaG